MYDGFYNLTKKPFQLTADSDFYFNSAVHRRALAYMRYGLTQGEGFVVVTGKPGTGKTMLVKELVNSLNADNITIGIMVSSQVGADAEQPDWIVRAIVRARPIVGRHRAQLHSHDSLRRARVTLTD
jgi:type II secretory pathway predicted ATPase ExeA